MAVSSPPCAAVLGLTYTFISPSVCFYTGPCKSRASNVLADISHACFEMPDLKCAHRISVLAQLFAYEEYLEVYGRHWSDACACHANCVDEPSCIQACADAYYPSVR